MADSNFIFLLCVYAFIFSLFALLFTFSWMLAFRHLIMGWPFFLGLSDSVSAIRLPCADDSLTAPTDATPSALLAFLWLLLPVFAWFYLHVATGISSSYISALFQCHLGQRLLISVNICLGYSYRDCGGASSLLAPPIVCELTYRSRIKMWVHPFLLGTCILL